MEKKKVEEEDTEVENDIGRKGEEYDVAGRRIFRDFSGKIIPSRERTEEEKGEKYDKDGIRLFDGKKQQIGEVWENGKRIF